MEETVGFVALAKEQSVETHPLGTRQRRCFHILGTLYDGYAYLLCLAVAAGVLEGRQHDDLWLHVHNLLDYGIQTVAAVNDVSLLDLQLYVGQLNVLRVGHTHNAATQPQLREQGAMDGREDGSPLNGNFNHGAVVVVRARQCV